MFPRAPEFTIIQIGLVAREVLLHLLGDLVGRLRPDLDELLTTLVVGDQALLVLALDLLGLGLVTPSMIALARPA